MSDKLLGMHDLSKLSGSIIQFYENQKRIGSLMELHSKSLSDSMEKVVETVNKTNDLFNKMVYSPIQTQKLLHVATAYEITSMSDKIASMAGLSSSAIGAFSKLGTNINAINNVWKDAFLELGTVSKKAHAFCTFNEKLKQSMILEIPKPGFYSILEFNNRITRPQALSLAKNNIEVLEDADRIDEKLLNEFGDSVRESLPQLVRDSGLTIIRDKLLPCEGIPIDRILSEADEMVQSYQVQYILENSLRCIIGKTLEKKYGEGWLRKIPKDIRKECWNNIRKKGVQDVPSAEVFLSGANYTRLADIILHNAPDFGLTTRETKDSFKVKMSELSPLRIDIGHVRYLDEVEQQRLRVYLFDLTGIRI